jgi:hypothetical protein
VSEGEQPPVEFSNGLRVSRKTRPMNCPVRDPVLLPQPPEPMKLTVHGSEQRQYRDLDDAFLDLEAP